MKPITFEYGNLIYNLIVLSIFQIESIEFCRMEQTETGEWIEDHDQTTKLKANFIISAFGSELNEKDGKLKFSIEFFFSIYLMKFLIKNCLILYILKSWMLYHQSN